eukprot:gene11978-14151_t
MTGSTASKSELQGRLQQRIQEAREKRRAEEQTKKAKDAKEFFKRQTTKKLEKREKMEKLDKQGAGVTPEGKGAQAKGGSKALPAAALEPQQVAELQLDTTRLEGALGGKKGKKAVPKAKQLEKAEKLQEILKEGGEKAGRHMWSAAEKRAQGEKVLDDPKMLRKTLKREAKIKKKSSDAWEKRVALQKETTDAKQKKRKDNLQSKKNQTKEKRIAKREKKLMRPGFEGRKEGFLNKDTSA